MKPPILIVNFKTYSEASGNNALLMAKLHEKVAKNKKVTIAIAVPAIDLKMITSEVNIPVLAQHFDMAEPGAFTGHVTPYSLQSAGAYGSLLNHSEKRIPIEFLENSINLARKLGLFSVVCADSVYTGKAISELDPDMVAVEPPELIGGDISVCTANPQVIPDAVSMIGEGKVLVGAGIKTKEDARVAVNGGAAGILVASGVIRAMDPEKALNDLADGLLKK